MSSGFQILIKFNWDAYLPGPTISPPFLTLRHCQGAGSEITKTIITYSHIFCQFMIHSSCHQSLKNHTTLCHKFPSPHPYTSTIFQKRTITQKHFLVMQTSDKIDGARINKSLSYIKQCKESLLHLELC